MAELRIYLCALSNPIQSRTHYEGLVSEFEKAGLIVELSDLLELDVPARRKAEDFNKAVRSGRYSWIVDVSGGDLANLVLPYLDYEAYASSTAWYAGFSDCTCIVNALAVRSHRKAMLFPLWNQTVPDQAIALFRGRSLPVPIRPLKNSGPWPRHARVSGGNIRCFLKLAGTEWMPSAAGSFLILESMSADWNAFRSMAAHLDQCGLLEGIQGIVLGRFNRLEDQLGGRSAALESMTDCLSGLCGEDIGWYAADTIGHIPNSTGLWISPQPSFEEVEIEQIRQLEWTRCAGQLGGSWNAASEESQALVPGSNLSVYQPQSHLPGPLPSKPAEKNRSSDSEPLVFEPNGQDVVIPPAEGSLEYDDDSLFDFDPDMTAEFLVRQWTQEFSRPEGSDSTSNSQNKKKKNDSNTKNGKGGQ